MINKIKYLIIILFLFCLHNYCQATIFSDLVSYNDIKIYKSKNFPNKLIVWGKITKVKDGDTFVIGNLFNARLYGIDTPESKQRCLDKDNNEYNCGIQAKQYLREVISPNNMVICLINGTDQYGRYLLICENNDTHKSINKEMVRNGWAVSYLHNNYKNDEQFAKDNKLGMWGGKFDIPAVWRRNNKKK